MKSAKPPVWLRVCVLFLSVMFLMPAAIAKSGPVDFQLVDLQGSPVKLSQHIGKGQWLLVMFWATDCVICAREKPAISAFHDRHKDNDANVIGVALDGYANKAAIERYLGQHETTFPTLTGEFTAIADSYEQSTEEVFRGTPTYLLYTPDGELVGNNPGPLSAGAIERFIKKYDASHQ
ncbi:MAG: TlpA family protein disulfide reductase [Gammaproteobacteria bacterium]|nr:TlpA family protein disulfide reductase [Gammaproteobacteria bacterium]